MKTEVELAETGWYAAALALANYLRKTVPGMSGDGSYEIRRSASGGYTVLSLRTGFDGLEYEMGLAEGWCAALQWEDS